MLTTYPKMNERSLQIRKLQLCEHDASEIVITNIPADTYPRGHASIYSCITTPASSELKFEQFFTHFRLFIWGSQNVQTLTLSSCMEIVTI